MGISAESFPSLPSYEEEGFVDVETEILKEMVEKTIFAVSADESRYNLTGVFFTKKETDPQKEVRMVATDGYRVFLIDRALGGEVKGLENGILLPKKGLLELNKILEEGIKESAKNVALHLKGNNFILKKDPVILIMRLLDKGVKIERSRALRGLAARKAQTFRQQAVGDILEVVILRQDGPAGLLEGLSDNYLRVWFPGDSALRGSVVHVRVEHATTRGVLGSLAPAHAAASPPDTGHAPMLRGFS